MAKLLKCGIDLVIEDIEPADKENGFSLNECYKALDCNLVEVVELDNGKILICDEEGSFREGNAINEIATGLASSTYHCWMPIIGNVIMCDTTEFR